MGWHRIPVIVWAPVACVVIWGASACRPPQGSDGGDCFPETCNRDPYCDLGLVCVGGICRPGPPDAGVAVGPPEPACDQTSAAECSAPSQEAYLCMVGAMPSASPLRRCVVDVADAGAERAGTARVCCTVMNTCVEAASEGCGPPAVDYACHGSNPTALDSSLRCLQITSFAEGYRSFCCVPIDTCFADDVRRYQYPSCDGRRFDCLGDAGLTLDLDGGDAGTGDGGSSARHCRLIESISDGGPGTAPATAYCCEP